uniref:Phosphatidate cytidylyltransferase n=1 Tax=Amphora coffeiformis TaxID=265554 RepID=A0A7S3KYI8_9STRA
MAWSSSTSLFGNIFSSILDAFTFQQVYAGHVWVCLLVMLIQMMLFRELVSVRYSVFFHTIEDQIPLFRTTQWMWFAVAISYAYGDFLYDLMQSNDKLHRYMEFAQYLSTASFGLYATTFCITIATLQRGYIRFQINQLCWTVVVLCLTVGQLKYVMHNIFNGLFWYVFPCCLVFTNDIMAYVCGMTWGRKFIQRPFLSFSPNKTWEGFIGGALSTVVVAWYLSKFLAQYEWMTCPTNEIKFQPVPVHCDRDPIFLPATSVFPSQMMDLLPRDLIKLMRNVVQICEERRESDGTMILTPCVSGNLKQTHHHFELTWKGYVPIQIHSIFLSLFASLVAPFGGFLASAIKRAYGIKDFASIIPGHGGVMDRMDCQFIMALYTWVHFNTFVRLSTVSVPKLVYLFSLLSKEEKEAFVRQIQLPRPKPWSDDAFHWY